MALVDFTWYCNFGNGTSTGYYAVALRPNNGAVAAGAIRRQFTAPAVGSERCFVCIVAGTTAAVTDATWVLTRGAKTTDGTVTWMECTGQAALNGDLTNTVTWAQVKAATPAVLGQIIKRSNGASYQICTTAGAMSASEPAFSDTAGVTTTDTTAVWTSLGPVSNFTGGQAPFARLASVCASGWFAAGNTCYVGANHAETQATAITISPLGSNATVGKILCHNQSGSYPPAAADLTTGATVSTTGNVTTTFSPAGPFYVYGITFKAAVGVGGSSGSYLTLQPNTGAPGIQIYFDSCSFEIAATASGAYIQIGLGASNLSYTAVFNSSTVKFGNVGQYINVLSGQFIWQSTGPVLVSGSSVPSVLIQPSAAGFTHNIILEAIDLSQLTGVLCGGSSSLAETGTVLIKDCKLNASATVTTPFTTGFVVQLVRCDSGATAYKSARYNYEGTETTETSITRVGGAADPTGQAQSRKIATTANAQWLRPFKAEPYAQWNSTTGADVTVTVCGTVSDAALPNNDDIWMEVEYLGSATDPLGKIVTTTKASVLASNAAVSADVSAWNGMPANTTFDGTPSAGIVMSNGNLTATHGTTNNGVGVISASDIAAGKYYFEITTQVSVFNGNHLGLYLSGPFSSAITSGNATAVATGSTQTFIYSNGSSTAKDLGVTAVGDVFGFAIDLTNRLAWVRKNAGNWNADPTANPATGVGGVSMAAGNFTPYVAFTNGLATDAFKGNFGQVAYVNTPPGGFNNWPIGWWPFKLTATLSSPQPQLPGYLHARIRAAKPSTTFYIDPQVVLS